MSVSYFGLGLLDSNYLYDNGNAQAIVVSRGDTLAIAFRGTEFSWNLVEAGWDWFTNFVDGGLSGFQQIYSRYQPLIDAFWQYRAAYGFANVLVAGHSQGGAIVDKFLADYGSVAGVEGVTLASPGSYEIFSPVGDRQLNILHVGDVVPDLLYTNGVDLIVHRADSNESFVDLHSRYTYMESIRVIFGDYNGASLQQAEFAQEILDNVGLIEVHIGSASAATGDAIYGGTGRDAIFGREGQDDLFGGDSRDLIDGGEGSDDLRGEGGNDELHGGASFDFVYGGTENDALFGGDSFDHLYGEAHDDQLHGDAGNDNLFGGTGNDALYGGADRDTLRGEDGNDALDGGVGTEDVAVYGLTFAGNYWITDLGGGNYRIVAQSGQEGTDTLTGIERLRFGDGERSIGEWLTIQNGTTTPPVDPPVVTPPPTPGPTTSALLSISPVNQTLRVGESIGLSAIIPQSGWVDNDGPSDIRWVYVQDRTAGGGYLTNNGIAMNANSVYTVAVADLANWRFVAGSGSGTDELGFNIVQADYDYSPRLNPGAIITTIPANTVTPPLDDHANTFGSATVMSSSVVTGFVSANGHIGTSSDQDWFSVQLQAGQTYAFVLWPNSTTNSHLDPRLTVRLPNGSTVTNDNLSATTLMSFVSITATQTGTYYLRAEGVNGTTGDFMLTVSLINLDPTAGGLTQESGDTDPNPSNSYWQWEGTSGNDAPSDLTLESGGRPQTSGNNYYRGHDGDDRIYADSGDDVVWGDDDEDRLYGEDGNDTLRGGRDDDSLSGGDGNDLLYGEDDDDTLSGGNDNDTLYGGAGIDDLNGNAGDDYLKGEAGNDDLSGGSGNDQLYGDQGNDVIGGGPDNDFIMGGFGDDTASGGSGHDRIAGEDGDDFLDGDDGDDHIYGGDDNDTLRGGDGNDLLHGEDGDDTADFSDGNEGIQANLFDEISVSTDLGTDRLYEIENVRGSDGDDVIDGDHGQNILEGNDGDDIIRGHNGNDNLSGGTDRDILWGDVGNDVVSGDEGNDELRGGLGTDTLNGGDGDDRIRGEQGNDTIDGGLGSDTAFFWGEREDFSIVASGAGFVVTDLRADGQEGQDTVSNIEFFEFFDGSVSAALVLAPTPVAAADQANTNSLTPIVLDVLGNDSASGLGLDLVSVEIQAGGGIAYVSGNRVVFDPRGAFDSLVDGATALVTIVYELRSEALLISAGTLEVTVKSASDNLTGDESDNELSGYEGNDSLSGLGGNDTVSGGTGDDVLDGGSNAVGGDTATYGGAAGPVSVNLSLQGIAQDTIGAGIDTLFGIENLIGSAFNDTLVGDGGSNSISGGAGLDLLNGGSGNDSLDGGAGNDTLNGGANVDTASFIDSASSVTVNLAAATPFASGIGTGFDTLISIENVNGSRFNDVITGSAVVNYLYGNAGRDSITGLSGGDVLYGGDEVGAGDNLYGGTENDYLFGGGGNDNLYGEAGADQLRGEAGNDFLYVDGLDTVVNGGSGYDWVVGLGSATGITLNLGASQVEGVQGSHQADNLNASSAAAAVVIYGFGGVDTLIGSAFNDYLYFDGTDVSGGNLLGNAGFDWALNNGAVGAALNIATRGIEGYYGNLAAETISANGATAGVIIYGNGGGDIIEGSGFGDYIYFEADTVSINGGAGIDYAIYNPVSVVVGVTLNMTASNIEIAVGRTGGDTLNAAGATWNVQIHAGGGADTITAGNAGSTLKGEAGIDVLISGTGTDYMFGGSEFDTFRFADGGGIDYIYDWQDGTDRIDLSPVTGIDDFTDLTINTSYAASNWYGVNYGSGTVWVQTGGVGVLDAGDFIY